LAWVSTKDQKSMNHLLSGMALVAALATAAPVWGQTAAPVTTSASAAAAAVPAKAAAAPAAPITTSASHKQMHVRHRVHHHAYNHAANRSYRHSYRYHAYHRARPGDIPNQLNAQELGRVGSSSVPGTASSYGWGYDQGPAGYRQPSPTQGIHGAWQPSPSSHVPSGPGPQWVPGYQSSASSHPPGQMR
jgi:hypothetical protein